MWIFLLACRHPGNVGGVVVDARTNHPISGLEVAWVSDGEGACKRRATLTDALGSYHLDGICEGSTYHLETGTGDWWGEAPELTAAEQGAVRDLRLWKIPLAGGVYTLTDEQTAPLRTIAIDELPVVDSSTLLPFPLEIPGTLPQITGDTVLLLVGSAISSVTPELLLPGAPLQLGSKEAPQAMGPWFYLGYRVESQTSIAPVVTSPTGITSIGSGPRQGQLWDEHALPPGRYAFRVSTQGTRKLRAYLLDFGVTPKSN